MGILPMISEVPAEGGVLPVLSALSLAVPPANSVDSWLTTTNDMAPAAQRGQAATSAVSFS